MRTVMPSCRFVSTPHSRGALQVPCSLSLPRRCKVVVAVAEIRTEASEGGGFFSAAFRDALGAALERQQDGGEDINAIKSGRLSTPKPKISDLPDRSATVDTFKDCLESSKVSLNRLLAMRNELDKAIDREKLQIHSLTFALDKAEKDEAYYRVLRIMQEHDERRMEQLNSDAD